MTARKRNREKGIERERRTAAGKRPDRAHLSIPRKRPRQARARATVAAILTAAAESFAELGYAGATTNRIARRAGVSVGSLYQYFPNKDALLAGLMERHQEQVHAAVEEATRDFEDEGIPIREAFHSMLTRLVELHQADPTLNRAIDNTSFHLYHAAGGHEKEARDYARWMERILLRRADVRRADAGVMAHVVVQTTEALTRWLVHEMPGDLDRKTAMDEVVRLLDGYVRK